MGLKLGDFAPNFQNAQTSTGEIKDFHEWMGPNWAILFSHPKDFTPVCTTELGYMAKQEEAFRERGVKILALSVDSIEDHLAWKKDIEDTQSCTVTYPIIADPKREIAELYDMIHPEELGTLTVRSVFVIGPDKRIKLMITYPASTGRNFDELLRVVDSLQLTHDHKVATPVNWRHGEDCIVVPTLSDEEATKNFPKGFAKIRDYLRVTPQPNL